MNIFLWISPHLPETSIDGGQFDYFQMQKDARVSTLQKEVANTNLKTIIKKL